MKYKVLSSLKHNGDFYEAGSIVEMDPSEAEVLTTTVQSVDDNMPHIEVDVDVTDNEPSMDWTRAQLSNYAVEQGIEVSDGMTKAKILASIQALPAEEIEEETASESDEETETDE